jgi:hypothetical protein
MAGNISDFNKLEDYLKRAIEKGNQESGLNNSSLDHQRISLASRYYNMGYAIFNT